MDRREDNNRRKIPRFTSKSISSDLLLIKKINYVFQGIFVILFGYFLTRFLVLGPDYLAHFVLVGGPSLFCAFRLRDMNQKIVLFVKNDSINQLEATTRSLTTTWLLYCFLFALACVIFIITNPEFFLSPFQSLLS